MNETACFLIYGFIKQYINWYSAESIFFKYFVNYKYKLYEDTCVNQRIKCWEILGSHTYFNMLNICELLLHVRRRLIDTGACMCISTDRTRVQTMPIRIIELFHFIYKRILMDTQQGIACNVGPQIQYKLFSFP